MKAEPVLGKFLYHLAVIGIMLCSAGNAHSQDHIDQTGIDIPIGGNSWLLHAVPGEEITNSGFSNWHNSATICRTFFRVNSPGTIHLWLFLDSVDTNAVLQLTIGKVSRKMPLTNHGNRVDGGTWKLNDSGYFHLDVRGVQRKNLFYGKLTGIRVEGTPVNASSSYVKNNDDNDFYWGRRGPSVHLNYKVDSGFHPTWFYTEITVPRGNDIIGSYFMANGFAEGYFGIQVNNKSERRILFSIWSPYNTDEPESIPDSLKIKLVAKGSDVHTGEFGNEGAGGQSYLIYNWKAETTYGFLTQARPNANNSTTYTSWFYAPETGKWKLIASFTRPSTYTYLKRLHSFLENFEPETGMINRKAIYGRQFIADEAGQWKELNIASFSVDQTGKKNFRKDFFGKVDGNAFVLENCGFFNKYQSPGTLFIRKVTAKQPEINFALLPKN